MSNNNGGPAFPQETAYVYGNQQVVNKGPQGGMTLRDYFAAKAMAAWIAGPAAECMDDYDDEDRAFTQHQMAVAVAAYGYADAMLKARVQQ